MVEALAAGVWETEFLSHEIMQSVDTKAHHLWLCSHRAEEERQVDPRGCLHGHLAKCRGALDSP